MDNIVRHPIQQPSLDIELVQQQTDLNDFIPKYQYKFSGVSIPDESQEMFQSLKTFLEYNQELITSKGNIHDTEEYAKGFKQAIALCGLWIDSIYLERNDGSE